MSAKIAIIVFAGALLTATAGHAQSVDLSTMTCKELIELPKETISSLTLWLDGYLTEDDDPRTVDLTQIKAKAEKLSSYCAQNPRVRIMSAAEDVIEK